MIITNRTFRFYLLAALAAVLVFGAMAPAVAEETPMVNLIEVRGLNRIDESSVKFRISHVQGVPLDSERVTSDIQNIYRMGYFDDVSVEVEVFEGGVKLIYLVVEKPVITKVTLSGFKKIEEEKLTEILNIMPGSIADTLLIQGNADMLAAYYSSKGFSLAEVVPVIRMVGKDQAVLTYQIDEGPKVKIKKVVVKGSKGISKWAIKRAMKTSKWWPWSFMSSSGYYEKYSLKQDVQGIRKLYFDKGYLHSSVLEPTLEFSKNKKSVVITIRVVEGDQYTISRMALTGNTVFNDEKILKVVESKSGDVFNRSLLESDVTEISALYGEIGYAASTVYPDLTTDDAAKTVGVTLRVSEGEIYRIGKIEISGNHKTRDRVIRREFRQDEGDRFNGKLLKRSYDRLKNTNFFEDVKIVPNINDKVKVVDIGINVTEQRTGSISLGAGYSSVDGIVGMVEFAQGNFLGRGQTIKAKAEVGGTVSEYQLSFTEPWLFGRPISFTGSVFNTKREYADYNKKATGFSLGLGKEIREYWRAGFRYSLISAEITDVDPDASIIIKDQEGTKLTSSITLSLSRDTRDNYLVPHRGTRASVAATYAGLGGDNKFVKVTGEAELFLPVTKRTTVALRARAGGITGFGGVDVPLYERFYLGGIHTIRGLDFGHGGPRDDNGEVIGGLKNILFNLEYIVPLSERMKFYGVVFFDAGKAFDEDLGGLRYTTGAGIRWISPMGPLRLEWGYNLDPLPDEASSRWEFSIGTFF